MSKYYLCEYYKDDIQTSYHRFDKIDDLYNYMGWIINERACFITFTYLVWYDFAFDTFDAYIDRIIKEHNGIVAKFKEGNMKTEHIIKLEVKE